MIAYSFWARCRIQYLYRVLYSQSSFISTWNDRLMIQFVIGIHTAKLSVNPAHCMRQIQNVTQGLSSISLGNASQIITYRSVDLKLDDPVSVATYNPPGKPYRQILPQTSPLQSYVMSAKTIEVTPISIRFFSLLLHTIEKTNSKR